MLSATLCTYAIMSRRVPHGERLLASPRLESMTERCTKQIRDWKSPHDASPEASFKVSSKGSKWLAGGSATTEARRTTAAGIASRPRRGSAGHISAKPRSWHGKRHSGNWIKVGRWRPRLTKSNASKRMYVQCQRPSVGPFFLNSTRGCLRGSKVYRDASQVARGSTWVSYKSRTCIGRNVAPQWRLRRRRKSFDPGNELVGRSRRPAARRTVRHISQAAFIGSACEIR